MAVKRMDAASSPSSMEDVAREAYIMSSCSHPNIAEIYGEGRRLQEWATRLVV